VPNVVSNTGPIIALSNIGQFALLGKLFNQILIPSAVRAEVLDDVSLTAIAMADWLSTKEVEDKLAVQILTEELDLGESEAIILAKEIAASLLLIDERAATRKARALGLRVIGTLGVLLMAKRAGHIELIKPMLDALHENGFRMSADLYAQVLKEANEAE
jgi:uncharacterized protein